MFAVYQLIYCCCCRWLFMTITWWIINLFLNILPWALIAKPQIVFHSLQNRFIHRFFRIFIEKWWEFSAWTFDFICQVWNFAFQFGGNIRTTKKTPLWIWYGYSIVVWFSVVVFSSCKARWDAACGKQMNGTITFCREATTIITDQLSDTAYFSITSMFVGMRAFQTVPVCFIVVFIQRSGRAVDLPADSNANRS